MIGRLTRAPQEEVTLPDGRTLEETIPQREIIDIMVPIEYDEYPAAAHGHRPDQEVLADSARKRAGAS